MFDPARALWLPPCARRQKTLSPECVGLTAVPLPALGPREHRAAGEGLRSALKQLGLPCRHLARLCLACQEPGLGVPFHG